MSFETQERIIAVHPETVPVLFPVLLEQYGEDLPDGNRVVRTIGGHWDDDAHTWIRAASLHDGTITGTPLIDGRLAFKALWQSDLAQAFDDGEIEGVEELTEEQYKSLIYSEVE